LAEDYFSARIMFPEVPSNGDIVMAGIFIGISIATVIFWL
jgi:hypothetical protein